jgi:hypothetical protein
VPVGRLSQRQVQCPFCIPSANQLNINFLLHFLIRELLKSNLYLLIHFFFSPFSFFPTLPIYRPSAFIFTSIFLLSLRHFTCLSMFLSLCLTLLLRLFLYLYFCWFLVLRVVTQFRTCLCGISTGDTCF